MGRRELAVSTLTSERARREGRPNSWLRGHRGGLGLSAPPRPLAKNLCDLVADLDKMTLRTRACMTSRTVVPAPKNRSLEEEGHLEVEAVCTLMAWGGKCPQAEREAQSCSHSKTRLLVDAWHIPGRPRGCGEGTPLPWGLGEPDLQLLMDSAVLWAGPGLQGCRTAVPALL